MKLDENLDARLASALRRAGHEVSTVRDQGLAVALTAEGRWRGRDISGLPVVDEAGLPTDAIADKSSYHLLDALRYCALGLEEVEPASVTGATNTDRWRDATSRF